MNKISRQELFSELNNELDAFSSHIDGTDNKKHIEIVDEVPTDATGIFFEKQGENPDAPDSPDITEVVNGHLADRAVNIKSHGAVADGRNSKPAIEEAMATSKEVFIPSENFTTTDPVWLWSPVTIKGNKGSKITQSNQNASGDLVISSSNVTLDGVDFEGSSTSQGIYFASNVKNFELKNSTVKTPSQAIHINNPNTENIDIVGNDIVADSYGVLTNYSALHSKNINILFNNIYSKYSDAIELNNPNSDNTISWQQAKIIGNTITADEYGSGPQAGFAIGIANTRDVVIVGNIVAKSRLEALHIEDGQENIVATGNVFNGCLDDGARIQAAGSDQTKKGKPVIISNNHFMKHNLTKTGSGIWRINNSFGVTDLILTSNYIRGFNKGITLDGSALANVEGCYIEDCNTAISLGGGSRTVGTVTTANCDTLVWGAPGSMFDKVISKTPVTHILRYTDSDRVGATLKAFSAPTTSIKSSGSGMNKVDLFKLPTRMSGKLIVTKNELSINFIRLSCNVLWDGTTLTVSNAFSNVNGAISEVSIVKNGDSLAISFWTGSTWDFSFNYDFEGEFYQA